MPIEDEFTTFRFIATDIFVFVYSLGSRMVCVNCWVLFLATSCGFVDNADDVIVRAIDDGTLGDLLTVVCACAVFFSFNLFGRDTVVTEVALVGGFETETTYIKIYIYDTSLKLA